MVGLPISGVPITSAYQNRNIERMEIVENIGDDLGLLLFVQFHYI